MRSTAFIRFSVFPVGSLHQSSSIITFFVFNVTKLTFFTKVLISTTIAVAAAAAAAS
jgi:hypothetical protein